MTALKLSQVRTHSPQLRFVPPSQRTKQTSALAAREKQKIQLSHSFAEPRPPGIALRRRSKTANGPRSFVNRWLNLKVASDPRMKRSQRICFYSKKAEKPVFPIKATVALEYMITPGSQLGSVSLPFAAGPSHAQGKRLEQTEEFEDDHDNDNHSNYIKDISVHKGHSYQIAWAMVNPYRNLSATHRNIHPSDSIQLTTGRRENCSFVSVSYNKHIIDDRQLYGCKKELNCANALTARIFGHKFKRHAIHENHGGSRSKIARCHERS